MLLALSLGLLTTIVNLAGSYLAVVYRYPPRIFVASSIGFGGGFLLGAALLELVPRSLEQGASMPVFIVLGYLTLFIGEHLFNVHLHTIPKPGEKDHSQTNSLDGLPESMGFVVPTSGLAILVAFNIHDLIDGLAIGSGMVQSESLGILTFLAVVAHELPAGFVVAAVIRASGKSRVVALLAGLSLGLITLVGIVIPFWVGSISAFAADAFLAIAAGSFIYIGASILIPSVETSGSRLALFMVGLGFAGFFLTSRGMETLLLMA